VSHFQPIVPEPSFFGLLREYVAPMHITQALLPEEPQKNHLQYDTLA